MRSSRTVDVLLGRHQCDLLEGTSGRRLLGYERQFEVIDDAVRNRVVRVESDDFHLAAALGTDYRVDFINLGSISAQPFSGVWECMSSDSFGLAC